MVGKTRLFLTRRHEDDVSFRITSEDKTTVPTHLFLNGGKFSVTRPQHVSELYTVLAHDIKHGVAPPITQNRTFLFPFFADLDYKGPWQTLGEGALQKLATVLNTQLQRFFEDRHQPFVLLLCGKNKVPTEDNGKYKHGFHIHWPDLIVDIDRAYELRQSMIAALDVVDWSAYLGDAQVDWEDTFDRSVYRGGLRMIGAPKAKLCPECKGKKGVCGTCGNMHNGYLMDDSVYELCLVMTGTEESPDVMRSLRANLQRLLLKTSVRVSDDVPLTDGYQRYLGCPRVPSFTTSSSSSKKRKLDPGEKSFNRKYRDSTVVGTIEVHRVMRELLVAFNPLYANSRITVLLLNDSVYCVKLQGDGAHFCPNKKADHNSSTMYMLVQRGPERLYEAILKCRCAKMTIDDRVGRITCNLFSSREKINDKQERILFPDKQEKTLSSYELMVKQQRDLLRARQGSV